MSPIGPPSCPVCGAVCSSPLPTAAFELSLPELPLTAEDVRRIVLEEIANYEERSANDR